MAAGGVEIPRKSELMVVSSSMTPRVREDPQPTSIIDELDERKMILPQQQHLPDNAKHSVPEELFQSLIIPACHFTAPGCPL